MTTSDLIKLLKSIEFGASGRAREISITTSNVFMSKPDFKVNSTSDGCAGAELSLLIEE